MYLSFCCSVESVERLLKHTHINGDKLNVAQAVTIKEEIQQLDAVSIPQSHIYDYIIVGAGPSGSIIANKLHSANRQLKILVLEAGIAPPKTALFTEPKYWTLIQEQPQYEWGYATTYQKGLYGRSIPLPRCHGLGGCTIHNSLMWVRGGKESFESWETKYGCKSWGWDDLLPLFHELEEKIKIREVPKPRPLVDDFIKAGEEVGLQFSSNYNNDDGNKTGVAHTRYTISEDGKRENIYDVYLKELSNQNVVDVKCHRHVNSVLLRKCNEWEAYGVQCYNKESCKPEYYGAKREVILTAGVFGSPQILMCSGVGRQQDLEEAHIECKVDSPGVGQNLMDDIFLPVTYTTRKKIPEDFNLFGISGVVMFPSENDILITVQGNNMPGICNMPESWAEQGYQIGADCYLAESRGFMKLDPLRPTGLPIIDMKYLDKDKDLQQCIKAISQVREVGQTEALKHWGPQEVIPGPGVTSKEALEAFIRGTGTNTTHHPSGTCRMGPDPNDCINGIFPPVLDSRTLKVYGCSNLRVMDNSVFPENPRGNPAAAVFVVALKGAEMLIKDMA